MTQSVELVLAPVAEAVLRAEWDRLADAGLPSERRTVPSPTHRPHLTLYAAEELAPGADEALPELFADLELTVQVGALMLFGPRRDSYVLVRQVVASVPLLDLQQRVVRLCQLAEAPHFAAGRWSPHVTVARRVSAGQVGEMLAVLARASAEGPAPVAYARRWDSEQRRATRLVSVSPRPGDRPS